MTFKLTDEELAKELMPDRPVDHGVRVVSKLKPKDRAAYVRMIWVARQLEAGIVPPGVMVDRPKKPPRLR